MAPWAARSCSNTDTSPCATVSCTSRAIRLRSAAAASARAFDSAASWRRALVIAIAACLANSSSSSASSSTNSPAGVAGEHHQGADDVPAPPDGDADHALERFPVLGADVPPGNIAVVLEDHRTSPLHERAGRSLREREHLAGLAGDPDVGLLAIDAGRLVHQADRAGVAAQQLRRTFEDPFEQRAERQLAGQILDHRPERLGRFPSIGRPAASDGAVRCAISAGDHDQRGPFREGSPAGNPMSFRSNEQSGTCRRSTARTTTLNRHGSPTTLWVPSQNGLLFERPQRQSVTRFRTS